MEIEHLYVLKVKKDDEVSYIGTNFGSMGWDLHVDVDDLQYAEHFDSEEEAEGFLIDLKSGLDDKFYGSEEILYGYEVSVQRINKISSFQEDTEYVVKKQYYVYIKSNRKFYYMGNNRDGELIRNFSEIMNHYNLNDLRFYEKLNLKYVDWRNAINIKDLFNQLYIPHYKPDIMYLESQMLEVIK